MNERTTAGQFAATRWTLVLRAGGETETARQALGELCETYWQPVFRFLRAQRNQEEAARELTQAFMASLLSGTGVRGATPDRGRFRSYLLGALKHFLADQRDHALRRKRGGDSEHEPIDAAEPPGTGPAHQIPDPASLPDDCLFDKEWALEVLDRVLTALAAEFEQAGKSDQFRTLKPWLVGETEALSQADAAASLGMTEGAVKVAIHRLRKRLRELVRNELAQTVDRPEDVDAELRYLVEVMGKA